jgi:hypothetical protein
MAIWIESHAASQEPKELEALKVQRARSRPPMVSHKGRDSLLVDWDYALA